MADLLLGTIDGHGALHLDGNPFCGVCDIACARHRLCSSLCFRIDRV